MAAFHSVFSLTSSHANTSAPTFFHAGVHIDTCVISVAVSQEKDLVIVKVLIGILSFILLCIFVFHLEKNGFFFSGRIFYFKALVPTFFGMFLAREMGPGVCLTHHKWCMRRFASKLSVLASRRASCAASQS